MSQVLFNARRQLAQVSSLLKQGKLLSAVQGMYNSIKAVVGTPLMRAEQEEMQKLIEDACTHISNNKEIRVLFPLQVTFAQGEESTLLGTLSELLGVLQSEATKEYEAIAAQLEEKKQRALDKGQNELDTGKHDDARQTFSALVNEFTDDAQLATDVGDRFMRSGLYEEASQYFESSLALKKNSPHVFNRLGIALRKIKRYEAAEENFQKALEIDDKDPNLYFNLGRLYCDWEKWPECLLHAEKALELNSEFTQARQLADYVRKMKL